MNNSSSSRILQLFDDLQEGDCWIGMNFTTALDNFSWQQALKKANDSSNSAWQLVNHLIYWRKTVLLRLEGKDSYPAGEDFHLPADTSEKAWQETIGAFHHHYFACLRETLDIMEDIKLNEPSARAGQTNYQLIMGCLQHDCYHLGQIVQLKKM